MLIETARRAEIAVKEMLDIANEGSATTDELRDALEISKLVVGTATASHRTPGVCSTRSRLPR